MSLLEKIIVPFKDLGFLLFPELCEGCKQPLLSSEDVICLNCETQLSKTNYHHIPNNETAVRLQGRIPFQHATSFAYFTKEGLLQHLLHGLKYKDKKQNGYFLGKELGNAIKNLNWGIDAIVPVPLHSKKELQRGYNQSAIIAEGISEILNIPVITNCLIRTKHTESQTDKTREERIENVHEAFKLIHSESVINKHILLIDDVLTTGATIESCALSLMKETEIRISIATCGIAVD